MSNLQSRRRSQAMRSLRHLSVANQLLFFLVLVASLNASREVLAIVGYYNVNCQPGDNLVALQLYLNPTDSPLLRLNDQAISGNIPNGATIQVWDQPSQQFSAPSTYHTGSGWDINYAVPLGGGVRLHTSTAFTLTVVGDCWYQMDNEQDPWLGRPVQITSPGLYLLSDYLPIGFGESLGDDLFQDIVGHEQVGYYDGQPVTRLNRSTQTYDTRLFVSDWGGKWYDEYGIIVGALPINVGEAAFFRLGGATTPLPPIQDIPEPSTLVLLGIGAASLLAYAWRRRCRVPSLFRISLIVAVGLSLAVTSPVVAEYGSKIERFNVGDGYGDGHPYYTNLGGAGYGDIYCADSWSWGVTSPYHDSCSTTTSGAAFASAQSGRLGIGFTGSLNNFTTGTYGWVGLLMGADAGTQFWDHFTIGPGDSGLPHGAPVQFAFHVSLTGSVSFNGNDSGPAIKSYAGQLFYDAQLQGTHLNSPTPEARYMYAEVRYPASASTPIRTWIPGESETISLSRDFIIDTWIGDQLFLYQYMTVNFGNGAYTATQSFTDYMDFMSTGTARLGYAPGFENIAIVSDAGAPVPEPGSLIMLAGIALTALWYWWRKRV